MTLTGTKEKDVNTCYILGTAPSRSLMNLKMVLDLKSFKARGFFSYIKKRTSHTKFIIN